MATERGSKSQFFRFYVFGTKENPLTAKMMDIFTLRQLQVANAARVKSRLRLLLRGDDRNMVSQWDEKVDLICCVEHDLNRWDTSGHMATLEAKVKASEDSNDEKQIERHKKNLDDFRALYKKQQETLATTQSELLELEERIAARIEENQD